MSLLAVVVIGLLAALAERCWPARPLPRVPGWWPRVLLLNLSQVGAVLLAGALLDPWLRAREVGLLPSSGLQDLPPLVQGSLAYLVSACIYYVWHRARHEVPILWRWLHQTHHAPERIEVFMAFYKHPAEALLNVLLSSGIAFLLLGCSAEGAAVSVLLSGSAELFYHLNLRTPRWLGYLVQRPEMHRIHHQLGQHRHNYADLPLIDLICGTYLNPLPETEVTCGLGRELELRFEDQLLGRDLTAVSGDEPLRFLPRWLGGNA